MTAPLVFLDTETTGLHPDDHIWEFAAVRRDPNGARTAVHMFVEHDLARAARLPEAFRADHDERYDPSLAVPIDEFASRLRRLFVPTSTYSMWPHVVGAVPSFDTARLEAILRRDGSGPLWHHHLIDVETLAVGWLWGRSPAGITNTIPPPPWDTDQITEMIGIDITKFARHTAMGDVLWAEAIYDRATPYIHRPARSVPGQRATD